MARGVTGLVSIGVDLVEHSTALGIGSEVGRLRHAVTQAVTFATGTTDGQLDRVWSDEVSLTTTPTDVDLVGSLTSELTGQTTSFADVVLIVVRNLSASGNILVGGDAASIPLFSAANDVIVVPPGGTLLWYGGNGIAATATTADILQLAASTGTVTCGILFAGRSA